MTAEERLEQIDAEIDDLRVWRQALLVEPVPTANALEAADCLDQIKALELERENILENR